MILLAGAPIPPSTNHQYSTIVRGGKTIRVPSKEATHYKRLFAFWKLKNARAINAARDEIKAWGEPVEVCMYVCFSKERLFTKDHRIKKLDITNRVKSIHDLLCEALGFDDSMIVSASMEKCAVEHVDEQVLILLRPYNFRLGADVYAYLASLARGEL